MNEKNNISCQLKALLEQYDFNIITLSNYLQLTVPDIRRLAGGDVDFLPDEPACRFRIFNKISFLYQSAVENKDLKLCAFLEVLLSYHGLSKQTIAKMADVEVKEIEGLLANPPKEISGESRFKIAVTVASLRFFLKDCEPEP